VVFERSNVNQILYFLIAILVLALFLAPIATAIMILRKLDEAARVRKRRFGRVQFRFFIFDFFSLIFLLQLPFGFVTLESLKNGAGIAVGFLCCALVAVWWTTIRTVSDAGITTVGWRAFISMVVIPATFIGSFYIGIAAINFAQGEFSTRSTVWMVLAIVSLSVSPLIVRKALAAAETSESAQAEAPQQGEAL